MQTDTIILLVVMAVVAIVVQIMDYKRSERQTKAMLEYHKASRASQDQWLFEQLYSMAPGKVLKPDEPIEESEENVPATVIHTSRDPMNEFKGKKDDWR